MSLYGPAHKNVLMEDSTVILFTSEASYSNLSDEITILYFPRGKLRCISYRGRFWIELSMILGSSLS